MKLFFELIKNGVAYAEALKGANVTDEAVKTFLTEQDEQVSTDELSEAVATKVLEKINGQKKAEPEKEEKAAPVVDAAKITADVIASLDGKISEILGKTHGHIDPKAPAQLPGKPSGYEKLEDYQKPLLDAIVAHGRGAAGLDVVVKDAISLTDGDRTKIIAARKKAGLSDMKVGGKGVTIFGNKGFGGKILDSTSGDGSDYIPTTFADALHIRMGELSSVLNIFDHFTQTSATQNFPLLTTRPTTYGETAIALSGTESNFGTGAASMVAKDFIGKTGIHDNTLEDTAMIINLMPLIEQTLAESMLNALVNSAINGDTTGTHMDSDIEAVDKHHAKQWKGARRLSLGVTGLYKDISSGGLSAGNMAALVALMGKYALGSNVERCRILLGVKGTTTWRGQFVDPSTPGAWNTLITGIMPPFLGIQPVTESLQRETLNASGVYDGSTLTKGNVMIINGAGFLLSTWKDIRFEIERDASTRQSIVYATSRKAFTPYETPSATVPTVAIGYNYTA